MATTALSLKSPSSNTGFVTNSNALDFDIVVVGAGLLGSSTAMHLAALGARSVAVLDADLAGRLSSSELNAGGARATWDQPINVSLAHDSIAFLAENAEAVGFRACGYLWMYAPAHWAAATARADHLAKQGLGVEVLNVGELQSRAPFIDKTADLAGATFSPRDGLFNPNLLKGLMRDRAREKGVQFLEGHRVQAVSHLAGKVELSCEVIPPKNESELKHYFETAASDHATERRVVRGGILVNAAGPWASRLASLIGYSSPAYALRRQVSIFDCKEVDMSKYGMMVDTSGVYFHPEANNILGGWADPEEAHGFNLNYDGMDFFQERIWAALYERSTKFAELKHLTGWGGLYENSPDKTGILGRVTGFKNVFENHGYSGRGAMQSYAAGRGMAELIMRGRFESLDLSAMNGDRFARGGDALLPEGLLI